MNKIEITKDLSDWFHKKWHTWFVQYNPLYFFSALCLLLGMFLIAQGLEEMDWRQGQLLLTAVIQLYEILLLTGGALLFRVARQYRPAVILGLIELFFLFDCTFRTMMMTTLGGVGSITTVVWVAMVTLKLYALAWAFCLKLSLAAVIVPTLAAAGIAEIPHALELFNENRELIHLGATWYGVILLASILYVRPKFLCTVPLDDWGQTVMRRVIKTALVMWSLFYLFHLITWIEMFSIPFSLAQAAPFFLMWFFPKKEAWAWAGGLVILALTSVIPPAVTPTALMVGIIYSLKARQTGRHRFYLGTVLYIYFGLWAIGWEGDILPEPKSWLILSTAMILLLMAWYWRLPSAIPATVLIMLPGAELFLPQGTLQWGTFTLVIGFATLIAGFALNWTHRRFKLNGIKKRPIGESDRRLTQS
ncbi:MAG: hypothetical protein ABII26_02220 [Pseudomonadota bacterium]